MDSTRSGMVRIRLLYDDNDNDNVGGKNGKA